MCIVLLENIACKLFFRLILLPYSRYLINISDVTYKFSIEKLKSRLFCSCLLVPVRIDSDCDIVYEIHLQKKTTSLRIRLMRNHWDPQKLAVTSMFHGEPL